MMDVNANLLAWHAGLVFDHPGDQPNAKPLADALWRLRKGERDVQVDIALEEVVGLLQEISRLLNGALPSESSVADRKLEIPREIVAAVATIQSALIETAISTKSHEVLKGSWRMSFAWQSVLAGDVDDVGHALKEDELARF